MEKDPKDFDKEFSKIIDSDDLKKFSENFKKDNLLTFKDLVLIQQSLLESSSNISEILFTQFCGDNDIVKFPDSVYFKLLSAMYKISIDFNDIVVDYMFEDSEEEDELDD